MAKYRDATGTKVVPKKMQHLILQSFIKINQKITIKIEILFAKNMIMNKVVVGGNGY